MENSLSSSVNKAADSKGKADVAEESGWTAYFEDFLSKQREEHNSNSSDSFDSPSLVSDAASCAAWKKIDNNNQVAATFSPMDGSPMKSRFKKTRTKEISHDNSLEDTASSPVNSPKVSSMKQMDINSRKAVDNIECSVGKGVVDTDIYSETRADERNEINSDGKINCEYTELKKRGLCLVPLSMLVDYVG